MALRQILILRGGRSPRLEGLILRSGRSPRLEGRTAPIPAAAS